jgi:hypothetical protein
VDRAAGDGEDEARAEAQVPERVLGLLQLERRHRAKLPQAVVVDVAAVADVVVRAAALLLNLLHALQMEP